MTKKRKQDRTGQRLENGKWIKPWGALANSHYTDEQQEWIFAIFRWRDKHGRPPTLIEAFRLAIELGYRKQNE